MNTYNDPEQYFISKRFDIKNLIAGMKNSLDTLAEYKMHPLYIKDVEYHIDVILEGTFILEKYIEKVHELFVSEEDDENLKNEYIFRNKKFIEEHNQNELQEFYSNVKKYQDKVYNEARERVDASKRMF